MAGEAVPLAGLAPGELPLRIQKANDYAIVVEFLDQDMVPIDSTGWTFDAQIRETYQGALLATFSFDRIGLLDHQLRLSLTAAQTDLIGEGTWPWDFIRTGGDTVRTLLAGVAVVVPNATEV